MKKKKSVSALLTLAGLATVLASCSSEFTYPKSNYVEDTIVSVDGKQFTFTDLYGELSKKSASASAYFNTSKKVIAQLVTQPTAGMRATVQRKIDDLEETWKKNASDNGTSVKEEREKGLESENVLTMDDLRAKYLANEQIAENENAYKSIKTSSNEELYSVSEQMTKDYVNDEVPYHVSHILVKVDASSSSSKSGIVSAKISSANAEKLGNTIRNLTTSTKFSDVAYLFSDDEGSANNYGELAGSDSGVSMNKSTSYINEFKLGLYAYDSFINNRTKNRTRKDGDENVSIKEDLRVPSVVDTSPVKNTINDTKIANGKVYGIPLSAALSLKLNADVTKSDNGEQVTYNATGDKATENSYPRNIIFNNYFNQHSVSFIYDDREDYPTTFVNSINDAYGTSYTTANIAEIRTNYPKRYEEYEQITSYFSTVESSKFKPVTNVSTNLVTLTPTTITKTEAADSTLAWKTTADVSAVSGSKKILCASSSTNKVDPIIVVRGGSGDGESGYQGIHFIVVNHSRFEPINNTYYSNNIENDYKYWRVNTPNASQTGDAYTDDYSKYPSFINFVEANISATSSSNEYVSRSSWVQKAIQNYDSHQDYRIYQYNREQFKQIYNKDFDELLGKNIADAINGYITNTLDSDERKANETLDDAWETYINSLVTYQNIQPKNIVPMVAIPLFQSNQLNEVEASLNENK